MNANSVNANSDAPRTIRSGSSAAPRTPFRKRTWLRRVGLGAVILVPLAFAGLFVGALSSADSSLNRIPAAVVNNDTLSYRTAPDGSTQPVFAGRQLVTELTGNTKEFDWVVTNQAQAKKALAAGDVYAILTIPDNFSQSILSLSTSNPTRAGLANTTDDSHSYLSGTLANSVGDSLAHTFGNAVTAQYLSGIYSSFGTLGTSLGEAASGAGSLDDAITSYTGGVDSLSTGLGELKSAAGGLDKITSGVTKFTGSIGALAGALANANAALQANPNDPVAVATVNNLSAQLTAAAAGGMTLASQTSSGLSEFSGGVAKSADGAKQLAAGSSSLRDGAGSLATGLKSGAAQVPTGEGAGNAAEVAADPIAVSVTRDNEVSSIGKSISTFLIPLGLWVGALAVFLVLRPVGRRELASTARNGRLVLHTLAKASAITAAQAILLVALLHLVVGVSWASLPATLGFSVLMALAFTAFHYLLTIGLGRGGLVVSLFVLAVQVTATGGLYPIELLATPFQWVSPFLPLTYGVSGMQSIIASGAASQGVGSALVLLLFGIGSVLVSVLAIRRIRQVRALQVLPAGA